MVGRGERIIGVKKMGKKNGDGCSKTMCWKTADDLTADARRTNAGNRDKLRTPHWLWQRQGDTNEAMDSRTMLMLIPGVQAAKPQKVTLMVMTFR